ncbi:LysM peptidoglycan-binding domain-containing protein [Brachybacterium paraconglomeratum]|uniref:LysM peptidoglycan-binding domain-containing protein n=1 Tax=Brachybacterium paraconglomeratum TaxID=173362 RepID=UPI0031F02348
MGDDSTDNSTATTQTHAGVTLLCTVLAAGGAVAMAMSADSLRRTAQASYADQALIGGVLAVLAALGALLCLYLAAIWGLATAILLAGPATRTGAASLVALRLLAPRLAQRVATGAALATTATALVLTPAMASEGDAASSALSEQAPAQASQLLPTDSPIPTPASDAAGPGTGPIDGRDGPRSTALLPPLGWGEESPAPQTVPDEPAATVSSSSAPATPTMPTSARSTTTTSTPHTVIVRSGDSLWSITDELLGPGTTAAAEISTSWPLLHAANQEVIGADPDRLLPGMELTVPHSLITKDMP